MPLSFPPELCGELHALTLINTPIIVHFNLWTSTVERLIVSECGIWCLQVPPMFNYSGDQSRLGRAHQLVASHPKQRACVCAWWFYGRDRGNKMRLVRATWRLHLAACINKNIMSSIGARQDGARISASPRFPDKETPIPLFSEFDLYLSPFRFVY